MIAEPVRLPFRPQGLLLDIIHSKPSFANEQGFKHRLSPGRTPYQRLRLDPDARVNAMIDRMIGYGLNDSRSA